MRSFGEDVSRIKSEVVEQTASTPFRSSSMSQNALPEDAGSRTLPVGDDDKGDESDGKVLMDLSDDTLLLVLGYLDALDLLKLRLLSRRLRDIALHPHLWRRLTVDTSDLSVFRTVLSLAPCVGTMDMYPEHLRSPEMPHMFSTTNCAVHVLNIKGSAHLWTPLLPELALRRQMLLGKLRGLSVQIGRVSSSSSMFEAALEAVERCSLEELDLRLLHSPEMVVVPQYSAKPSLKTLTFHVRPMQMDPTIVLLCNHAGTLQEVDLYYCEPPPPMELLAALPRLRKLSLWLPEDMRPLLQCPTLTSLRLTSIASPLTAIQNAADFLRDATMLQELSLDCRDSPLTVALFGALATPGHAALQRLKLHEPYSQEDNDENEILLAEALPHLPGLRVLDLLEWRSHGNLLLFAITPTSAPSLRELWVRVDASCLHVWLHEDGADFFEENPAIHVITRCTSCDGYEPFEYCREDCTADCHPALKDRDTLLVGLTSHSESPHCGLLHQPRILNFEQQSQRCTWDRL